MTKKILSVLLAVLLAVSCVPFAVSAEENVYYVEEGSSGDGTEDSPFGTLNEAIEALAGKDGTIKIFGTYTISGDQTLNEVTWDGMITFMGINKDSVIAVADGDAVRLKGDATFKDIGFAIGKYAHFNPYGKLIMDGGKNSDFTEMFHLTTLENEIVSEAYAEFKSGNIGTIHAAGGYCTLGSAGCEGSSTIVIDGANVANLMISADYWMGDQIGINIGGDLNIIVNSGNVQKIAYSEQTVPALMSALNIVLNNGIAPEHFVYPKDIAPAGTYVVRSEKGGMVAPTSEPGVFEVKADSGKVACVDGEVVNNGKVTLTEGEHYVEWVAGEQGAVESTEIKLVIGKAEIVTNGVAKALDVPAQIIDSRTMVPLRAIFEALGATVEWDDATKTVTSTKDGTTVKLTIGVPAINVDGTDKALDVAAQIVESRTLVPARAVAEAYGCNVAWDDATKTVTITK